MNTKKIRRGVLVLGCVLSTFFSTALAENVTRDEVFEAIGHAIETPDSHKYINLYYQDIDKSNKGFSGLQKMVYTGKIPNRNKSVYPDKSISKKQLYNLLTSIGDKNLLTIEYLRSDEGFAQEEDLEKIKNIFGSRSTITITQTEPSIDASKLRILNDVYDTLNMNHIDSDSFEDDQLINSAIEGLAKGTDDTYTSYFPPVENKVFQDELEGEYEGIGAYVDMPEPGVVVIVSPIAGSPAEKSGLKGGDIIYSVDGIDIQKNESLTQVTAKIKGPAGTNVILGILRNDTKKDYTVTRGKIVLKDVVGEKIDNSSYYIQMKMFSGSIGKQFTAELEKISNEQGIEKIIIDLRNNPGGYLDQVVDILGHFVEKGKPVAIVKYKQSQQVYTSFGYDSYDFSDKEIVVLVNSGTASASEILAGTLKDYYPDSVTIVGETTFGKGSVQTQRYYKDGSALKYTVAKWYTGKTQKGIDEVGISPDNEVIFDKELWDTKQKDNQLEAALKIR